MGRAARAARPANGDDTGRPRDRDGHLQPATCGVPGPGCSLQEAALFHCIQQCHKPSPTLACSNRGVCFGEPACGWLIQCDCPYLKEVAED